MAYQILQFNIQNNLSTIPLNRAFSPAGSNSNLIFPNEKEVLIKKICLDCVYNQSGDILIEYYSLIFSFINNSNVEKRNDFARIINPTLEGFNFNSQLIELNKYNPIKDVNYIAKGLRFINASFIRNSIVLNQSINPINSTLNFLLSIYYEN
jgi:hypothetical protein